MRDEDKKSLNADGSSIITPGQELDISKRSNRYPTPPCALDATAKRTTYKSFKKKLETNQKQDTMFNNFFNDPVIKQLSQAYVDMISEGHTREELEKLDIDELKALMSEYMDKVETTKDEKEAEEHREELAVIKELIASKTNKSDSEEDEEESDTK